MEMSPEPESALEVAEHLRDLVPDAGHLRHTPSHIDILCGNYQRAIISNSNAIIADARYVYQVGALNFYTIYRVHNYQFRIYAAMFAAQSKVAMDIVTQLEASVPKTLLRVESPPMADWLEGLLFTRIHVLVRFGRWNEILDLEFPSDGRLWCVTTAMMHYAKGSAFAVLGLHQEAHAQRNASFEAIHAVPFSRTLFNNKCTDILAVARSMLEGETEYRLGNYEDGLVHLRRAVEVNDALPYDEPWGWMQPSRHAHGALLLECGYIESAAKVYAADLGFDNTLPRAL